MKKKKWSLFTLFLTAVIVAVVGLFAGCKEDDEEGKGTTPVTYDKGNYYYLDADDSVYPFTLGESDFVLETAAGKFEGSYTFDGKGAFTLNPAQSSAPVVSAKIEKGVLSVVIGDATYVCKKGDVYLVTYQTDNGASPVKYAVAGSKAYKPQDPVKEGVVFAGWYEDSAFTTPYDFTVKTISKATTIYARYVAEIENIFTVKFAGADEEIPARQANKGGVLIDPPSLAAKEGKAFLGWWMSDYEDAEKLTCQYIGQVLTQNVTLYAVWEGEAPMISVDANGASWASVGRNVNYTVTVTLGEKTVLVRNTTDTNLTYDFANAECGDYVVEVEAASGQTSTAYYRNKALDRVSIFEVDGFLIHFNTIANAQKYYVTVVCANEEHGHVEKYTNFDNGDSTIFDFELCDMKADGITFTVRTEAEGYLASTSETFTFERSLGGVQNITLDASNETFSWDKVDNAQYYLFKVGDNAAVHVYGETSASVKEYTGDIKVTVTPVAHGYNSPAAAEYTYQKARLATPAQNSMVITEGKLVWEAVDDAIKYRVNIGGQSFEVPGTEFTLPDDFAEDNVMEVTITALASDRTKDSLPTETKKIARWLTGQVHYASGKLTWASIVGTEKYLVKINDGTPVELPATATEYTVSFDQKGENAVQLASVNTDGMQSAWETVSVVTYAVVLKNNDRFDTTHDTLYRALNDPLNLPGEDKVTLLGYTFSHWSNRKAGAEYVTPTLVAEEDLTLYAQWTANLYTVTFNYSGGTMDEESTSTTVYYESNYSFPTAKPNDTTMAFAGWYSSNTSSATQYTDYSGAGTNVWRRAENTTLYARWVEVFKFNLIDNGNAYSVEKGPGIGFVTEITVPQTYNGKPVTTIEGSAFQSCNTLEVVNIYDTIQNITIGINGGNGTGSAFYLCSYIKAVNILPTEGTHQREYRSDDGVLIRMNNTSGQTELAYIPRASDNETFTIPADVSYLPTKVFYSTKYKKVVIPATVTTIGDQAFYLMSSLEEVKFEAAAEGVEELPLTIGKNAFQSCSKLETVTLPSRLSTFDDGVFDGCSNLAYIDVDGTGGTFSAKNGMLLSDQGRTLYYCPRYRVEDPIIPSSVETIGGNAFTKCTKITNIVIPGHVKLIEKGAFNGCTALESVSFTGNKNDPDLTIKEQAFYGCNNAGFTDLVLPVNLKVLEKNAFGNCTKLVNVTVLRYEDGFDYADVAFGTTAASPVYYVLKVIFAEDVTAVLNISGVFGSKVETIEIDSKNTTFTSIDDVIYDKEVTRPLFYPVTKTGVYDVPLTVTSIPANTFKGKTNLTHINISANVKEIGFEAFASCSKLESVTFPDAPDGTKSKLEKIGNRAFAYCSILENIELPASVKELEAGTTTLYQSGGNIEVEAFLVFYGSNKLHISVAPGSPYYAVRDNVLYKLNDDGECDELLLSPRFNEGVNGVLDIPGTITKIWTQAFYYNEQLTRITCSEGYKHDVEIGKQPFYYCRALEYVDLPNGIETLSTYFFYYCKITEITIPASVMDIEANAFYSCSQLSKIIFAEGDTELVLANGSYSEGSYGDISVTGAFARLTSLREIVFSSRIRRIPDCAFYGCTGLQKVVLSLNIERIGERAFQGCTALATVEYYDDEADPNHELPSMVSQIGKYAFYQTALDEIYIPRNVTTLGDRAYYQVKASTLTFEEGSSLTKLENYAFYYSYFTSANLPASLTEIGTYAFYYNKDLTSVTFNGNNLTKIGDYAFSNCTALESVTFPASIESIGISAFNGSSALATATFKTYATTDLAEDVEGRDDMIGKSALKSIGNLAFASTSISSFTFPNSCTASGEISLGTTLFSGCKNLTTITVSKSVKANIDTAFSKATKLNTINVESGHTTYYGSPDMPIIYNTIIAEDGTVSRGNSVMYIYGAWTESEFVVPAGADMIGAYAFKNQTGLTKIYLPDTLTSIGEGAFMYCINLKDVVFYRTRTVAGGGYEAIKNENGAYVEAEAMGGNGLTIGKLAFAYCGSLCNINNSNPPKNPADGMTSIAKLPANIADIGQYAFNFAGLKKLVIPTGLVQISGTYAFAGCEGLEVVEFKTDMEKVGNTAFAIGDYLFSYCTSLHTVTFAEGTKKIVGRYMFSNCTALEEISLPDSVEELPNYFLCNAKGLTALNYSENSALKTFGTYLFQNCTALESFTIPDSIKDLPNYMFYGCSSLKEVGLPAGVTTINTNAFRDCASLEEFEIPDTVTSIGTYAFYNCAMLKGKVTRDSEGEITDSVLIIPSKVATLGANAFYGCSSLKRVVFDTTTLATLDNCTFQKCSALESVTLPSKGLTKIGSAVSTNGLIFADCTSLREIFIPATVTMIGQSIFANNPKLTKITFAKNNQLSSFGRFLGGTNSSGVGAAASASVLFTTDGDFAIDFGTNTTLKSFNTTYTLGYAPALKSVDLSGYTALTDIKSNCFSYSGIETLKLPTAMTTFGTATSLFTYCSGLTSIEFPSLTAIPNYAFQNCKTLETVSMPAAKTLGNYAFDGCDNLQTVSLPEVTSLGTYAFRNCPALTTVTVGDGLTTIPTYAFSGCSSLTSINHKSGSNNELNVTSIATYAFNGCSSLVSISLPKVANLGTAMASSAATDNSCIFYNCTALESVVIADGVKSIGAWAFYGCTSLASVKKVSGAVNVLEGVTFIGKSAFCQNVMTSMSLPDAVDFGDYAFSGNPELVSVSIPKAKTITAYMFNGCESLTAIEIPSVVTTIGEWAFNNCHALKTIKKTGGADNVLAGITSIGNTAFQYCRSLEEISVPDAATVGEWVFSNCTGLKTVHSVRALGNMMFINCTSLETVTLDDRIGAIPNRTFWGCEKLTSINKQSSSGNSLSGIESLGYGAFYGCSELATITISDVASVGTEVFANCTLLQTVYGLNALNEKMFLNCASLETVSLGNDITAIPSQAFAGSALRTFTITPYITEINVSAFANCESFTGYTVDPANTVFVVASNGAVTTTDGELVYAPEGATIDFTGITEIGFTAYYGRTDLTEFVVPSTVTKIGNGAFSMSSLTKITIPASVTYIGVDAFYGCRNLTEVVFEDTAENPSRLATIDAYAFQETGLTSITLPASVTTLGDYVFMDSALENIVLTGVTAISANTFNGATNAKSIVISDSVTSIAGDALKGLNKLESLTIPFVGGKIYAANETYQYSFGYIFGKEEYEGSIAAGQYHITTSVTNSGTSGTKNTYYIPETLKTVTVTGGYLPVGAFSYCTGIETVTLAEGITSINARAFEGCENLTEITIPASVTDLGANAFKNCAALTTVTIAGAETGESVLVTLGASAFTGAAIESIVLPASLTTIGNYAFQNCVDLQSVTIVGTETGESMLTVINMYAFDNTSITSFKVPALVNNIGTAAFRGCTQLTSFEFNANSAADTVVVALNMFKGCTGISEIYIYENVKLSGNTIFDEWTKDQTVYIVGRGVFDIMDDWGGTALTGTSTATMTTWQTGSEAVVVWDYEFPTDESEGGQTGD